MARDTARKIARSPNGDHALVQRDATGSVQLSQLSSNSNTSVTATGGTAVATVTGGSPPLVAFDNATLSVSSGGTVSGDATPFDITISIDGSSVTQSTGLATTASIALTGTTPRTNTTPLNNPTYTFNVNIPGGSVTASWTASRESRWV